MKNHFRFNVAFTLPLHLSPIHKDSPSKITSAKYYHYQETLKTTQPAIPCSKLTIETLEQGVKYVQS